MKRNKPVARQPYMESHHPVVRRLEAAEAKEYILEGFTSFTTRDLDKVDPPRRYKNRRRDQGLGESCIAWFTVGCSWMGLGRAWDIAYLTPLWCGTHSRHMVSFWVSGGFEYFVSLLCLNCRYTWRT